MLFRRKETELRKQLYRHKKEYADLKLSRSFLLKQKSIIQGVGFIDAKERVMEEHLIDERLSMVNLSIVDSKKQIGILREKLEG